MTVLVVGASGNIGSRVVAGLLAQQVPVRAFVRTAETARPPASPLADARVEVAEGDLADPESIRRAAAGCTAMFLLTPHSPDQVALQNAAVDAAADVGAHVVKVSSWGPAVRADSPVPGARRHWLTQQYILRRQVPYTFLQPNYFMQVLTVRYAGEVRRSGTLVSPAGTRGISMVDVRDVADSAVQVLAEPKRHEGRSYLLSGAAAPTYPQIAAALTQLTGRTVTYHDMAPDDFVAWNLREQRQQWEIDHAAAIFAEYRDGVGELITGDVAAITGRAPRSIEDFLQEHRGQFAADTTEIGNTS